MPYLYGSISNASNDKGITVGAGYSFAGRSKGRDLRDAANAKCSALAAMLQLDEQQRWVLASINKAGARAELQGLLLARDKATAQLNLISSQLKAQAVTLTEYNAARQTQLGIEVKINDLRMILAQATQPLSITSVRGLLETAKVNLARASELEVKAQAEEAWDVTAVVGNRKNLGGSLSADPSGKIGMPFVGLTFKWSFGAGSATAAVKTVKDKTEQLFALGQNGYVQSFDRLVSQMTEAIKIDQDRDVMLQGQLRETDALLISFRGLETALALNAKRTLELQSAMQQAELDGVRKRLAEYQLFMSKL
jgi:hypothetical protein